LGTVLISHASSIISATFDYYSKNEGLHLLVSAFGSVLKLVAESIEKESSYLSFA
jgi:hypothetical protein